jgi:hypothetical protein
LNFTVATPPDKKRDVPVSIQPLEIPLRKELDEYKNIHVIELDVGGVRSNFLDKIKVNSKTILDTRKHGFTLPELLTIHETSFIMYKITDHMF